MLPIEVLRDARAKASALLAKPTSHVAAALMVVVWLGCAAGVAYWCYRP
jgi:hypothetical protein